METGLFKTPLFDVTSESWNNRTVSPNAILDVRRLTKSYPNGADTLTVVQDISFSLAAGAGRTDLQTLLARWSAAGAVLQQGKPVGTVQPQVQVQPPTDTGEAYGLSPASLTVTIGLGPSLFGDRFGLAARRPSLFADLPPLDGDFRNGIDQLEQIAPTLTGLG